MEYNSSIRSRLLEPVLDLENDRVEFRFANNELLKTNMRLMNLGVIAPQNTPLNAKAGILAMLEEVVLYDNNQVLDSIRPAANWLSFKKNLVSNRKQLGINTGAVGSSKAIGTNNNGQNAVILSPKDAMDDANSGNFTLNLRDLLPICRATEYLPTQVFKNLRLVIQFRKNSNSLLFLSDETDGSNIKKNPLLAVDMVNDPSVVDKVLKSFRGVGFNAIEYDSFLDPTAETPAHPLPAAGKQTKVSKRLFGLDGKFVNRLMICRTPIADADTIANIDLGGGANNYLVSSGALRAIANIHPSYQLAVNGSNLFVHEITDTAEIVAMTNDTWGNWGTTSTATSFGRFGMEDGNYATHNVSAADSVLNLYSRSSDGYFGCFIQNRIQSLEVSVGRLQRDVPAHHIASDTVYPHDQQVNIWAEVRKSIVLDKNGGYAIIYN